MPAIPVASMDEMAPVPGARGDAMAVLTSAPAVRKSGPTSLRAIEQAFSKGVHRTVAQQETPPGMLTVGHPAAPTEMVDVEATLQLVVDNVVTTAATIRGLARSVGALVVEDAVEEGAVASARFTIRVDASKTEELLGACERLGQVRARQVQARDIGQDYHDAELLLTNLEQAMQRYEDILKGATQVSDVLAVEKELSRLRAQIDKVKGSLLWMRDRVARSTVHVYLASARDQESEGVVIPHAKIYPGVRLAYLEDLRGNGDHQDYLGFGLSLRFAREFGLDVDGFRRNQSGSRDKGLDVFVATMGGEVFSDFLGRGRRRTLNPYLGWRLGYARFESQNEFAFAGVVGVELVKARTFSLDLSGRLFGLLGKSGHMAIEPALSANIAF
jgi:hypothetical protein